MCDNFIQGSSKVVKPIMFAPTVTEIESVYFEGYLEKQRKLKTWAWTKYWFVLEDGQLAYYKDETQSVGAGLIDLIQAVSIKAINNTSRNHSFEITMKDRSHIFCAESDLVKDQWVRFLQQARVLRPRRSSSMMRPRCNSISDDDCDPGQILSIEDLEPPDTPTSPPGTPNSLYSSPSPPKTPTSPPRTPTSPLKIGSPKFKKALSSSPHLSSSPKLQKAIMPKCPNSPKAKEFLDSPGWIKNKVTSASSSEQVLLKGIRRLVKTPSPSTAVPEPTCQMSEQTYALRENSVFYTTTPIQQEKSPSNSKSPVMAMKSNKIPVARVFTGPITSPMTNSTSNGFTNSNRSSNSNIQDNEGQSQAPRPVSRTTSQHPTVSRSNTRPISGPAHLTRARPVSGERPTVVPRVSRYKQSSLSTSSESESETSSIGKVSNRKLKRLVSNDIESSSSSSSSSRKSDLIPSKSSTGGVVLRRSLGVVKSTPFINNLIDSSDSEEESDFSGADEVFSVNPVAVSSPIRLDANNQPVMDDEYYERLYKAIREPRPPIPELPYPRLELTFRSAFDDIRLFLANNRDDDEIFPVPRKSERGGRAIRKLKKVLQILS